MHCTLTQRDFTANFLQALAGLCLALPLSAGASEALSFVNVAGVPPPARTLVVTSTVTSAASTAASVNADVEKVLTRPADLWERIRLGFAIPALDYPLVREHERWFAEHPEQLRAILERGRKYLHFIVEAAEQRGLPLELTLLPVIESGFNPMAQSPAQASGLWQFIPGTGARYGLEQSPHLDERRDVIASTAAAFDYLAALYAMFGDWHLALASYNWGENAVARAAERVRASGKEVTFGSLSMPEETRNYVPRLLALSNIVANPAAYGVALERIPNEPFFVTVALRAEIDFATAARFAGMTQEELRALNPGSKRPGADRGFRATVLVLPVEKVADFRSNLAAYETSRRPAQRP